MLTRDGIEVYLHALELTATWAGLIEGSPNEDLSTRHRNALLERLARPDRVGVRRGAVVLGSPAVLPSWTVMLHLRSHRAAATNDPDFSSELRVIHFTEGIPDSIRQLGTELAGQVDWRQVARDYDITGF